MFKVQCSLRSIFIVASFITQHLKNNIQKVSLPGDLCALLCGLRVEIFGKHKVGEGMQEGHKEFSFPGAFDSSVV
jgi:hypothetical protein